MNIQTLFHILRQKLSLFKRTSLTIKVLALVLVIGIITWVTLDYVQSKDIQQFFFTELAQELEQKARQNRAFFDRYIRFFQQAAKVIVSQQRFQAYISTPEWLNYKDTNLKQHYNLPPWLPSAAVMQTFFKARYAMLLGPDGQVREIYHAFPEEPPASLLQSSPLRQKLSQNQTYMTTIESFPYILTSLPIDDPTTEQVVATLLLVSPIDDEFMKAILEDVAHPEEFISLVGGKPSKVVSSSNPELIPAGTLLNTLEQNYLITGASYFDYGDSDLDLGFTSFVAKNKAYHLANQILDKLHQQRAVCTLVLVISFALLTLWITLRIKRTTQNILTFSKDQLGLDLHDSGDEIVELVYAVQQLQERVTSTIAQTKAIALGDYTYEIKLLSERDQLGRALSQMTQTLRQVIAQASAIAAGDYTHDIKLLSEQDQLGRALSEMTRALREGAAKTARQDWLKTGQTQLHDHTSGEQDLVTLAKQVITFLATYVEAAVGMFYLLKETNSGKSSLKLLASHAYIRRHHLDNEIQLGEGIIGQVAVEEHHIVLTQVPNDYIPWDKPPLQQVLAIPFRYEQLMKGVIELGFFKSLTDVQLEFLQQVMPSIGIAVNTAQSRTKMQELLRRVQ
jgi:hypothetical protein